MKLFKETVLYLIELNESACSEEDLLKAALSGRNILRNLVIVYYFKDMETNYHCNEINVIYKLLCDTKLKSGSKTKIKEAILKHMFICFIDIHFDNHCGEYRPGCLKVQIERATKELKEENKIPQKSGMSEQELHERCLNTFKWMINNICHSRFVSIKKCPALKEWLNPNPSPT